ncbi:hypothetical protein MJO28_012132 [Puccinia striiformis f. sp. tritici]|uniref:Uncharacterized protein n=1 Tax=Puccinia striiformis f. sp. tritici TaxID=168172 RepID=A0ACC0DZF0_9BASI|nr:hypothetical protein MJO28_012132 [Puccinia striiformis f. sp. tritici]
MPDISDLPNEVLGLILHLAVAPTGYRWYLNSHQQRLAVPIGRLRLVCRRWSHCLTEQHFNRELYIRSGTSAMRFIINEISRSRLAFSNVRPKCQVLRIGFFWTWGALPGRGNNMVIPSMLKRLIELFHDTIVELELEFSLTFRSQLRPLRP